MQTTGYLTNDSEFITDVIRAHHSEADLTLLKKYYQELPIADLNINILYKIKCKYMK